MVTAAMKLKDTLKESYDKPRQHIKKQRHNFADKGLYGQSCGFPVVMYGCESWLIKKAESQRIDASNCGAVESLGLQEDQTNQSQKETYPKHSFEGPMLKVASPIFWPPDAKSQFSSSQKTLMLAKTEGRRRRE